MSQNNYYSIDYYEQFYKYLRSIISENELFNIPFQRESDSDFFEFVSNKFSEWNLFVVNADFHTKDIQLIKQFSDELLKTIDLYLHGKILEATDLFNKTLNKILLSPITKEMDLNLLGNLQEGFNFYRARKDEGILFKNVDLFHVPFENRHIIATNRFSIPGLPALYLGDQSIICWEEYDKYDLRKLWFSKLQNQRSLNVFEILKPNDILKKTEQVKSIEVKSKILIQHFLLMPLIICCSVKVLRKNAPFKPEYIIPQLLLQYIIKSKRPKIDGIQYPSTKLDYATCIDLSPYNYVFPVKTNSKSSFCDYLKNDFLISEPTSLEYEEIMYNTNESFYGGGANFKINGQIELMSGVIRAYEYSSFGKIEIALQNRELKSL